MIHGARAESSQRTGLILLVLRKEMEDGVTYIRVVEVIPIAADITTNAIGAIGAVPGTRGRVTKSRGGGMTRGYAKARCTPGLNPWHGNVERIKPGYTFPGRSGEPENGITGRGDLPSLPTFTSEPRIVWQPYWSNSQPRRDWSVF